MFIIVATRVRKEKVKESLLMKYGALTSEAVQSLSDCAFRCGASSLSQASKTLRLEILERLLRRPQLMENLPHLRRLKRKQGFIDRLDRSLQQGRLCFESEEEYQVFRGRLKERHESSSLQNEVHQFGMVFDDYIKALGRLKLFHLVVLSLLF